MLHERIVELRKSNKLTQSQLAAELDITRSALSLYETGVRNPDYETLQKFADFFNVSVDYLLGRTEKPGSTNVTENESDDDDRPLTKEDIDKLFADDPEGKELMLLIMKLPDDAKRAVKDLLKQFKEKDGN